jgi:hypothetical protein
MNDSPSWKELGLMLLIAAVACAILFAGAWRYGWSLSEVHLKTTDTRNQAGAPRN